MLLFTVGGSATQQVPLLHFVLSVIKKVCTFLRYAYVSHFTCTSYMYYNMPFFSLSVIKIIDICVFIINVQTELTSFYFCNV